MDSIFLALKRKLIKLGIPISDTNLTLEDTEGHFPSIRLQEIDEVFKSVSKEFKNFSWRYRIPTSDYFFIAHDYIIK